MKESKKQTSEYPSGTLLCNHKCVHLIAVVGMESAVGTACSSKGSDRVALGF